MVNFYIDGNNVYHGLKRNNLKERDINWGDLFQSLLKPGQVLGKIYWFRPGRINFQRYGLGNVAKHMFSNDPSLEPNQVNSLLQHLDKLPNDIFLKVNTKFQECQTWEKKRKSNNYNLNRKLEEMFQELYNFKLVRCGFLKIDPVKQLILGEKGVDVSIAIQIAEDAIEDKCTKQILFSGDSDFEVLINFLQKHDTKIDIAMVNEQANVVLAEVCDTFHLINNHILKKYAI